MSTLAIILVIIGIIAMAVIIRKRKPTQEEQVNTAKAQVLKNKLESDTNIIYIFDSDFLMSNSGTTLMDKVFYDENVNIKKYIPSTVQAELDEALKSADENKVNRATVAKNFITRLPEGTLQECVIKNTKLHGEKAVIEAVKTVLQNNKDNNIDYVYFCTENQHIYDEMSSLKKQLKTDKLVLIRDMDQFENIPYNNIVL